MDSPDTARPPGCRSVPSLSPFIDNDLTVSGIIGYCPHATTPIHYFYDEPVTTYSSTACSWTPLVKGRDLVLAYFSTVIVPPHK